MSLTADQANTIIEALRVDDNAPFQSYVHNYIESNATITDDRSPDFYLEVVKLKVAFEAQMYALATDDQKAFLDHLKANV